MSYPHDYTPREPRHALGDLARDMETVAVELCGCGEEMEYLPAYPAEPDTGAAAWPGGFTCPGCGADRPDAPRDIDDQIDAEQERNRHGD